MQKKIHDLDPSAYTGAFHDEGRSTLVTRGPASPEVRRLVREFRANNPEIPLTLGTSRHNRAEWQAMVEDVARGLEVAGLMPDEISVGFSVRGQSIHVEVGSRAAEIGLGRDRAAQMVEQAHNRLPDQARAGERGRSPLVVFTQMPSEVLFEETHSYGGGSLLDDGTFECTSGFVGIRAGARGVITAAHCTGLNQYEQTNGYSYRIYFKEQHLGSSGDFEFHTTAHNEYDDFYYNWSSRRDVSSVQYHYLMDEGDYVWRFGRRTGTAPAAITQLWVSSGSGVSSLVRTTPTGDRGGDSGGPWSSGGQAWGIHRGHHTVTGESHFSVARFVGRIGASVATS